MKELSIEEKAKAYDEALKVLHKYDGANIMFSQSLKEEMFPELKESEDERVRKELGGFIRYSKVLDETKKRWLAWIEKQGEQKPYGQRQECADCQFNYAGECKGFCAMKRGEQKPADKVEPKFKVGDWIVYEEKIYQIHNISLKKYYECLRTDGTVHTFDFKYIDSKSHIWTIQDAKDGDVLVNQNGEMPFIFKECKNNHVYCYCGYTNRKDIFFDKFVDSENEELHWLNLYHEQAYPATKEQRDQFEKAMADAGYTFDFEKKELKKIEQKPAWSEEDETIKNNISHIIRQYDKISKKENQPCSYIGDCLLWMLNIKDRVQPQNTWKPSDEQMEGLLWVLENCAEREGASKMLSLANSIYDALKKLKQ